MTTVEQLIKKYQGFTSLEKRILELSALLVHVDRKGDFLKFLEKADLKNAHGKKLTPHFLNPLLDDLRKGGFLEGGHYLRKDLIHPLTLIALDPQNPSSNFNREFLKETLKGEKEVPYYARDPIKVAEQELRELHFAIYDNDETFFGHEKRSGLTQCSQIVQLMLSTHYRSSYERGWIDSRSPLVKAFLMTTKLYFLHANTPFLPPDQELWIDLYKEEGFLEKEQNLPLYILHSFCQIELVLGLFDRVHRRIDPLEESSFVKQEVLGSLAFFKGNRVSALKHYQQSLKLFGKLLESKGWYQFNIHGLFYFLTILSQDDFKKATSIMSTLKKLEIHPIVATLLEGFLFLKQSNREKALESLKHAQSIFKFNPTHMPLVIMLMDWIKMLLGKEDVDFKKAFLTSLETPFLMASHFYGELLLKKNPQDKEALAFMEKSPFKDFRFCSLFPVKEAWEYQIDQLHSLLVDRRITGDTKEDSSEKRLIWLVDPERLEIEALEQKRKAGGGWTGGKAVALKRFLILDPSLDYVTSQDKLAFKGIKKEVYGWYGSERFYWNPRVTLKALINHPLVFHKDNRKIPLEIVEGEVELTMEKREKGYFLTLTPHFSVPQVFLERESSNRYKLIDFGEEAALLSKIIPHKGLLLPFESKEKLLDIITSGKKNIKVSADVEENIPEVKGDTTPIIHLFPLEEGLKASLWIRPFKDQGPYVRPGEGQETIIATLLKEGKEIRQKAIRTFEEERKAINHLLDHAPNLLDPNEESTVSDLYFDSLSTALELLSDLEAYKKKYPLLLEWPKGETLKLKSTLSFENLFLKIRKENQWFEYEGSITLNNQEVMEMKTLLDLLATSPGRFIEIKKGEFIALQESFKRQLEDLKALSTGNRVPLLGTRVLERLAQDAQESTVDEEWKEHLQNLKSRERHNPKVPSTLQANLRDYQEEGFKYLSRLTTWGIGACLADDMGLGKTLQAIALLLEQSSKGPSLVVVPTSLSFTWREEILKFAPTLNPFLFHEVQNRKETIKNLKKRDILICSYGLLHQEGELLQKKEWQVVILDEAQSIKNKETKRWQYATALKSKSRIALTGTPIENHLGEIWSIFHFLNPGLLGSLSSFQQKFWGPIEKNKDPIAKRALKSLIAPYMLRRTKSQVLLELPPKTEQTLLIDPSLEERTFYEALRTRALETIETLKEGTQKRFQVLAEITKLRQACCDSSLVDKTLSIESSKIKTFLEIIQNLKENNHKALVFSQYVGYLTKIKEVLQKEGILYHYLDGSTPPKERQKAIQKFQEGEGDLFLISLKAGGTGLNLTAADYVIILDPWWNPAVEDQASARAHRMGQERPVTIYRLILKNTIEERIIKLHQDKRDLADELLSDSHQSSKLTHEDLLKLIAA